MPIPWKSNEENKGYLLNKLEYIELALDLAAAIDSDLDALDDAGLGSVTGLTDPQANALKGAYGELARLRADLSKPAINAALALRFRK